MEGSPGRQGGFAAKEGSLSFVLGSGAVPSLGDGAAALGLIRPQPPDPPWIKAFFFFFSAIDETRRKGAYSISVSFVSCNTFFSLWRFYGNHKNTTQNAAPTEID